MCVRILTGEDIKYWNIFTRRFLENWHKITAQITQETAAEKALASGLSYNLHTMLTGVLLLSLILHCPTVFGIKVFFNTINVTEQNPIGGASLRGPEVDIEDITLCIRFKFQMLGSYEGKSRLITIEAWR